VSSPFLGSRQCDLNVVERLLEIGEMGHRGHKEEPAACPGWPFGERGWRGDGSGFLTRSVPRCSPFVGLAPWHDPNTTASPATETPRSPLRPPIGMAPNVQVVPI
jgi:hypothetical protein